MCAIPHDCFNVIAGFVDELTLGILRLVSTWCCEIIAAEVQKRAKTVGVTSYGFLYRTSIVVKIPVIALVGTNWYITCARGCLPEILSRVSKYDRGIIGEIMRTRVPADSNTVYIRGINLYVTQS